MSLKKYIPLRLKVFIKKNVPFLKEKLISEQSEAKRIAGLQKLYKEKTEKELDLSSVQSFTEKIQWYKLFWYNPIMKKCVDKYAFKAYIKSKLGEGYTANLLAVWNKPGDVDIGKIDKDKFVIKSNSSSDGNYIKLITNKDNLNIEEIEKEIKENWFDKRKLLMNSYCRAYYGVKPRVIVEEFVEELAAAADDYKVFCFGGKPEMIYVAQEHFENGENKTLYPITFYDLNWNVLDISYGEHPVNPNVPRPKHLNEMIEIAEKLSADFPFVRVDFFDTDKKLYLAELTFYPGGGFTPYKPETADLLMGEKFRLPKTR